MTVSTLSGGMGRAFAARLPDGSLHKPQKSQYPIPTYSGLDSKLIEPIDAGNIRAS